MSWSTLSYTRSVLHTSCRGTPARGLQRVEEVVATTNPLRRLEPMQRRSVQMAPRTAPMPTAVAENHLSSAVAAPLADCTIDGKPVQPAAAPHWPRGEQ